MNPESIKVQMSKLIGKKILVTVYGMRNKIEKYEGCVHKIYPNFFTILYRNEEKSFNYRDIITRDVKIKSLNY